MKHLFTWSTTNVYPKSFGGDSFMTKTRLPEAINSQWSTMASIIEYNPYINPNRHETGRIYLLIIFELDFVSWIFIKNFQTFLEVKIEINRDNLTPFQANWVL